MTSVPYPTFLNAPPVVDESAAALSAVGRCRIHPLTCTPAVGFAEYQAIVSKCVDQSTVDDSTQGPEREANKKLKKKLMKESVAMAKKYVTDTLNLDVSVIDIEIVVKKEDILDSSGLIASCFLDAGCDAIVVDGAALEALDAARLPRERLVAHFDYKCHGGSPMDAAVVEASQLAATISITPLEDDTVDDILVFMKAGQHEIGERYRAVVQIDSNNFYPEMIGKISKGCKGKGTVTLVDPTATQLGMCYAACLKTDRDDGLFTTVVCTRSGEALGLVYSSKDSIVAALECGRGVYYSRSRNGLWRKGDTSGHYQVLHRIDVDCDGDALRFTVSQRGDDVAAFCHLNTLTCWGEPRGLRHLEGTLKQRLCSAPEGSYTKRLFDDEKLLRDKLVEEAQELSEAQSKQHVAEELADVIYFAMVRAAKAGVSIDDAAAELDRRARKVTRRKGDSKAFRIKAGDTILNKEKGS